MLVKIGVNTAIQASGKFFSVGLGFITIFLLTRYLGSSGYGKFTLAFTYVSFFSTIADLGLQSAMVRELAHGIHDKRYFGSFLILKVILIIFSSLTAIAALVFFPYSSELKNGIIIAVFAAGVSGLITYGSIIFQSRLRLDLVTYIDISTKIFTVIFIGLVVFLKLGILYCIATVLVGNLIGLVISLVLLRETISFSFNLPEMREMLLISIPIGITTFLGVAYFKIDTLMLSVMRNASEVGLYSLSYKVLENLLVLWGFYMASTYPLFAKLIGSKDIKKLKILFVNSIGIAFLLSFSILIVGFILAPVIIQILGGSLFQGSVLSLRIILFALPFLFINSLLSDFFYAHKETKFVFYGIVLSLILNVILNFYFIPKYGFIAASYITVVSGIMFTIYSILQIITSSKFAYLRENVREK